MTPQEWLEAEEARMMEGQIPPKSHQIIRDLLRENEAMRTAIMADSVMRLVMKGDLNEAAQYEAGLAAAIRAAGGEE